MEDYYISSVENNLSYACNESILVLLQVGVLQFSINFNLNIIIQWVPVTQQVHLLFDLIL